MKKTVNSKNIYMSITDKGGTGKTLFSRLLANKLISNGKNPLLVDGDGEIGGLHQFYDDSLTVRFTGEAHDRDELTSILDSGNDTIMIDMPAASLTSLSIFNDETRFFSELKDLGYTLTLINVITPFKSSIRTVKQMLELGGDNAQYVVVINEFFGRKDDFYLWYGDEEQPVAKSKTALAAAGGKEIILHSLQTGVLVAMDYDNIKFPDAIDERCELALKRRVHRSRLGVWLDKMDVELNKILGA